MTNQAVVKMAVQSRELIVAMKKNVLSADHLNVWRRARKAMLPIAMEL